MNTHVELNLASGGSKSFNIIIDKPMHIGLYAQHTAEEFNIQLIESSNAVVPAIVERTGVDSMNMMMKSVLLR